VSRDRIASCIIKSVDEWRGDAAGVALLMRRLLLLLLCGCGVVEQLATISSPVLLPLVVKSRV